MSKYKIGITEAGDAGIDLSWADKMGSVDGAVLVTKNITPGFRDKVASNMKKYIIHATCTGYGGTILEPKVPTPQAQKDALMTLVGIGFPKERIVIRVDPIIPTVKGLNRALDTIEICSWRRDSPASASASSICTRTFGSVFWQPACRCPMGMAFTPARNSWAMWMPCFWRQRSFGLTRVASLPT